MIKQTLSTLLIILVSSFCALAQQVPTQHSVAGNVIDDSGKPVAEAFSSVLPTIGMLIQQAEADDNGNFTIELSKPMTVKLFVTYLGYKEYVNEEVKVTETVTVPAITLTSANLILEEVVVVEKRQSPSIMIESKKLIYSPENNTTLAGSSTLEVLKPTP